MTDFLESLAGLLMIAVGIMILIVQPARAHDFYDPWCCDNKDCSIYTGMVKETPKGYLLHDGTLVPYKEAKISPDGKYHRCIWNGQHRCFYAPASSF